MITSAINKVGRTRAYSKEKGIRNLTKIRSM